MQINKKNSLNAEYQNLYALISTKNLQSKEEYKIYAQNNNLEIEPEIKYKNNGWKNYYHFLSISTDIYPKTLTEFKNIISELDILTKEEYLMYINDYNLPLMPEELYGFSFF